nr:ribonuclease H-like domain-containing protein [Tanacetum cinerariifolium]
MKALLEQQGLAIALEELPAATIDAYDNVIQKKAFSALILCLGKNQFEHIDEFHKLVGDLAAIDIVISEEDHALLLLTSLLVDILVDIFDCTHPMITQSQSGIVIPIDRLSLNTFLITPIPKNPSDALKDSKCRNAMYDEYNALVKNDTWLLVPRPACVSMVRYMWLFKHKFHADGTLSRYKARLVANGSSQQLGVDFDETFSPVVKPATIRTVLSLDVSRKWSIHQLDVKNTFLNGDLSENVYMHQPPGFFDARFPNHVCLYMHDPREPYFAALKHILRYVRGTVDFGLQLYASATTSLVGYTDADWAGCPSTRKSTLGYCVFLGDNLLSWSAKHQHTLSRLSAKTEYRGVANVVAETTWLCILLRELHSPLSTATLIYCDNGNLEDGEANGDGGEGLYVRWRSGQRDMDQGTDSAWSKSQERSSRLRCYICQSEEHLKRDCPRYNHKKSQSFVRNEDQVFGSRVDGYDNVDVMIVMSVEELLDWIMDSGGSYHITYLRDYLVDFEEYDGGNILLGDGRECRVRGTCKVQVQMRDVSSFMLDNVRYVPKLRRNLISLGTLEKKGFTVKMQLGKIKMSTQQCKKSGVAKHFRVAGIQQQNGLVEELNVTLLAKLRDANAKRREAYFAIDRQPDSGRLKCSLMGFICAFKGAQPSPRLTPDAVGAQAEWWLASKSFFDVTPP